MNKQQFKNNKQGNVIHNKNKNANQKKINNHR